jgi:N-acetylneuraminic acid mutarotase
MYKPIFPQRWLLIPITALATALYLLLAFNGFLTATVAFASETDDLIWNTGALLPTARSGSTTGWYNGRLFVACGRISSFTQPLNTNVCESYNFGENSWQTMSPAPYAVRMAGAGRVQSGNVLFVVGGRDNLGVSLGTNQAYNMAGNSWQELATCTPRWGHGAAATTGYVYVFGGSNFTNDAQRYSVANNAWEPIAPLPAGLGYMAGASLGGKIYSLGGTDSNGPSADCFVFDPNTGGWTEISGLPAPRQYHAAVGDEATGRIYVFGGLTYLPTIETATVLAYNRVTNAWTPEADMPAVRSWGCAGSNDAGNLFLVGGCINPASNPLYQNQTWYSTITPPPQYDVTLWPLDPPIEIRSNGGSFNFNASVINHGPNQASFFVWARMQYPDGSWSTPTLGPLAITPPVSVSVTRLRSQNIPETFPAGLYYYVGYTALSYPGLVIDSSYFPFTKSGSAFSCAANAVEPCYGELFPGEDMVSSKASDFAFYQASPNPFNAMTVIRFDLPSACKARLEIFRVSGRLVGTLVDGWQESGHYEVRFEAANLPSGLYLAHLTAGEFSATRKLILVK